MTFFLLVLAWLLCGVLWSLMDRRMFGDTDAMDVAWYVVLGPLWLVLFSACVLRLAWLDRYAEKHRRDQ